MLTPFGESTHEMVIAPEITLVSTKTHTAYKVSLNKILQMPQCLKEITVSNWYEGIDRHIVVLAFPKYFPHEHCHEARKAIFNAPWHVGDYFGTEESKICLERATLHSERMENDSK